MSTSGTCPPAWVTRAAAIVAPCRRMDALVEELDGEAVVADPQGGGMTHLNATALLVWRQCDGQTTTRDIARRLTASFAIDEDTALDHVDGLLALFARVNLLERLQTT